MTVSFSSDPADLGFLTLVLVEEQRIQSPLPVESLLALTLLREARRIDAGEVAKAIQKPPAAARAVLERLVEAGLAQAHGATRNRTYTLSPAVYRRLGQDAGYVRQAGFARVQQAQMVLNLVAQKGPVSRKDVVELCQLTPDQATRLLRDLVSEGKLVRHGHLKGAVYARP